MTAAASGAGRALSDRREHSCGRHFGRSGAALAARLVESGDRRSSDSHAATFSHRFGERDQIVLVGVGGGQRAGVPDEFPASRRGDAAGMVDTEVP